jgi:DNA-binding LacI/PurR family transcriptional regulator
VGGDRGAIDAELSVATAADAGPATTGSGLVGATAGGADGGPGTGGADGGPGTGGADGEPGTGPTESRATPAGEARTATAGATAETGGAGEGSRRASTIKDVAARAGVGVGTVSRVLNDHPAVTTATRQRVREAMDVLDFHPNRAARALSRQRSGAIAVIVPFVTQPSSVERLRGVLSVIDDSPFEIVLYGVDFNERRHQRLSRIFRPNVADGLLVVSLRLLPDEIRRLEDAVIPTVVIDAGVESLPSVVVDDVAGGHLAAEHLLALGHRRIAYIGDAVEPRFGWTSSTRRLRGLADALAAADLSLSDELVRDGPHGRDVAVGLATELLTLRPRPTAIFAHSDTQALGALEAAATLGLGVPDDVSVIGFDDIESARYAGLTTVRQPLFESGRLGASMLLDALGGVLPRPPPHVELPLEIALRRTTGPVLVPTTMKASSSRHPHVNPPARTTGRAPD